MDLSHPDLLAQRDTVFETLERLKIRTDNILNVGNKLDKCDQERKDQLVNWGILSQHGDENNRNNIFPLSCRTAEGMSQMIAQLDKVPWWQISNPSWNSIVRSIAKWKSNSPPSPFINVKIDITALWGGFGYQRTIFFWMWQFPDHWCSHERPPIRQIPSSHWPTIEEKRWKKFSRR